MQRRNNCRFIVIEGIDGSGKSTLAHWLHSRLKEQRMSELLSEPTRFTDAGRKIRELISNPENDTPDLHTQLMRLFAIDREWHVKHKIRPALRNGSTVVLDRYFFSTAAYQAQNENELEQIISFYSDTTLFEVPDIVIYLKLDPDTAIKRISARNKEKDIFESAERLSRIAAFYERAFALYKNSFHFFEIDASKDFSAIQSIATENLNGIFPDKNLLV